MSIFCDNEFEKNEKRFYGTAIRRGYASSSIVKLLILISMVSYAISLACTVDSGFQGRASLAFACALLWTALTAVVMVVERRKRTRDILLALDRCGECGQKLTGSNTYQSRGVTARSCAECGTVWTDLDRQASIESVYRAT